MPYNFRKNFVALLNDWPAKAYPIKDTDSRAKKRAALLSALKDVEYMVGKLQSAIKGGPPSGPRDPWPLP